MSPELRPTAVGAGGRGDARVHLRRYRQCDGGRPHRLDHYAALSNQLDSATEAGATRLLGYSASGNTATDDRAAAADRTYNYDSTDRLTQVDEGTATLATYLHNHGGQRIAKTVGATTTHYIYGFGNPIGETDGATGAVQAEYVWLGGMPLAYITGGAVYAIHPDHLGTPQRLTAADGAVAWDASYSPFGEATVTGTVTFNMRFPGQYLDDETGLHYNGFRDYDPTTGRYIQSDPIGLGGGWNTFAYAGGNPVTQLDPSGTRFTTRQNGNLITISATVFIKYKASSITYKRWQLGIDRFWNLPNFTYGKCNVKFNIQIVDSGQADNYVYDRDSTKPSRVIGFGSENGPVQIGQWTRNASGRTAAHEVGHFLGLRDDYHVVSKSPRVTNPNPGHSGHLMGDAKNPQVAQHEVDDMLSRVGTCGCQ